RSASYLKNETDLVILVTPHIVAPARPNDPMKTPLDQTQPPNDIDFFLMGKTELTPTMARLAAGANRPFIGHELDLPKGVAHVMVRDHPGAPGAARPGAAPGPAAVGLLGHLLRPPRQDRALRRRRARQRQGDPDRRSVAALQQRPQHPLQRRQDAGCGGTLPD